jgi:O-antigen/teichoic acid export membrane protein
MSSLFISNIAVSILTVILSIFIARLLGDVTFGEYAFVTAFIALFSIFLDLGYETLLIIDVSKDNLQASKYLSNIVYFRLLLSVIIFIVIFIVINVYNFPETSKFLIYIFGIAHMVSALSNIFRVTYRAFQRMDYEAAVSILTVLIRCSVGLLILFLGYGLLELAFVFLFSAIFELILSFVICEKKFAKLKLEFDPSFFKKTLKFALPLGALAIFGMIKLKTGTVLLGLMEGDAVVGWYTAALNLIIAFNPIPLVFMNTLLPYMSYSSTKSRESLIILFYKSFKFLFLIGLPASAGIYLLADKFILLFYGIHFVNSIPALRILSFDVFIHFMALCVFYVLISVNKQKNVAMIAGTGALIYVLLNFVLIPKYSLLGTAWARVISISFNFIMYTYIAYKNNLRIPMYKLVIRPIISCIGMIIFIYYFRDINLYLLIGISIIIYFGIFFILKGFTDDEIEVFKKFVKRAK